MKVQLSDGSGEGAFLPSFGGRWLAWNLADGLF